MTASKPLAGIYPYLVSPVDGSTGAILEKPLRALVDHLIDQGVQGEGQGLRGALQSVARHRRELRVVRVLHERHPAVDDGRRLRETLPGLADASVLGLDVVSPGERL